MMSRRRGSEQETNIDERTTDESEREISSSSQDPLNSGSRSDPPPVPPPPPPPNEGAPPEYSDQRKPPEYSEAIGLLYANNIRIVPSADQGNRARLPSVSEELNRNPPPDYIELHEVGRRDSLHRTVSPSSVDLDEVGRRLSAAASGSAQEPSTVPDVDVESGTTGRCATLKDFVMERRLSVVIMPLLLTSFVIFLVVLPVSFEYIHYHDIALKRSKWTGWVEFSRTYYSGCYVVGPQFEFLRFPATTQTMKLDLSVTSTSALSYHIHMVVVYQLNNTELPLLYQKFAGNYTEPMKAIIGSTVKNKAVSINMDEWFLNRRNKEIEIENIVKTRLQAYHIDVIHNYLHDIVFPRELLSRMMRRVVLDIKSETERYILQEKVESKRTDEMTNAVQNSANEVSADAVASAAKIEVVANAEGQKLKVASNGAGLKVVKSSVSLADSNDVLSYYLLNSLRLLSSKERLIVAQQRNTTKSYNKASGSFSQTLAVAAAGLAKLKP